MCLHVNWKGEKICRNKNILKKLDMSNRQDIGENVKIIFESDIPKIMKSLSNGNWISEFPNLFIELLNTKKIIIETIKYTPNIYFCLSIKNRKNSQIIKATINSFKIHHRINELNTHTVPLTKRMAGVRNWNKNYRGSHKRH